MADPPPYPDSGDDTGVEPDRAASTGMPRWQKVVGIIGLLVVLAIVILLFGPGGGGHGPQRHGAISPVADGAVEIAVTADDFAYDPDEITVTLGGDVAIVLTSIDILHDFTIDEFDGHVAAEPGETATGGFRADRPGRYIFYCAEPGHRQAGMEGTLIVEAGGLTPE
ncbi:MAG TPA: cupredoxin domain-containing protein [Nitriliruptorales bacterium]